MLRGRTCSAPRSRLSGGCARIARRGVHSSDGLLRSEPPPGGSGRKAVDAMDRVRVGYSASTMHPVPRFLAFLLAWVAVSLPIRGTALSVACAAQSRIESSRHCPMRSGRLAPDSLPVPGAGQSGCCPGRGHGDAVPVSVPDPASLDASCCCEVSSPDPVAVPLASVASDWAWALPATPNPSWCSRTLPIGIPNLPCVLSVSGNPAFSQPLRGPPVYS
jgi:hypothetical protein